MWSLLQQLQQTTGAVSDNDLYNTNAIYYIDIVNDVNHVSP